LSSSSTNATAAEELEKEDRLEVKKKPSYVFYVLLFGGIALIAFGIHKMFQVYDNGIDYYSLSSSHLLPYSLSKIIITILHEKEYFRFFWPASIGYGMSLANLIFTVFPFFLYNGFAA
jgi:hypothetical protein